MSLQMRLFKGKASILAEDKISVAQPSGVAALHDACRRGSQSNPLCPWSHPAVCRADWRLVTSCRNNHRIPEKKITDLHLNHEPEPQFTKDVDQIKFSSEGKGVAVQKRLTAFSSRRAVSGYVERGIGDSAEWQWFAKILQCPHGFMDGCGVKGSSWSAALKRNWKVKVIQ